jgi:DNA-binding XRE family transcriptional regulator
MLNTSMDLVQMSDAAIVRQIGNYIKQVRLQHRKTQAQLANIAGLNRWTISQIENGDPITLTSLIQVLRALDSLYVLNTFEVTDEISPLEYAKLKKHKIERVRNKPSKTPNKDNTGW